MLAEIGPFAYNAGVRDARDRIEAAAQDLNVELHREPLTRWSRR